MNSTVWYARCVHREFDVSEGASPAVALIGGTFDPVHFGHLRAALEVRDNLQLDELRFLPAGVPPHRNNAVSDATHRLEMLKRAVRGTGGFTIDEREIQRKGPSYMVDSLLELRGELGETPMLLVIGQDSANTLGSWNRWAQIFDLCHLVIVNRPGDIVNYPEGLEQELAGRRVDSGQALFSREAGRVISVNVTGLSISSSRIRELIRRGRSPRYLLPESVLEYIRDQGLYA